MSEKGFRVEIPVHINRDRRARKVIKTGEPPVEKEGVPRIARLLALAHKWERMVRRGKVRDYAEIARRHGLSRARTTQICGLVLLSPELQHEILSDGVSSEWLVAFSRLSNWSDQRRALSTFSRSDATVLSMRAAILRALEIPPVRLVFLDQT